MCVATVTVCMAGVAGCQSGSQRVARKMKYGPPPPGDLRIIGEAVPGWKPEHMNPGTTTAGSPMSLNWTSIGPRPIQGEFWSGNDDASGRVVSIAVHPVDGDIVYAASASGGLWKTTDAGGTWAPLTDELSILNHGHVALDPSNPDIVFLGTGEYTVASSGDGVFRSQDAGITWARVGTTADVGTRCSGLIVDPNNPGVVHLTGSSGYVRSMDGGNTWDNRLSGSASSLVLNPVDTNLVYVGRHGDGIYRSEDGGDTFSLLTNGLPGTGFSRIVMAISASNPGVLYAAMLSGGSMEGFYKTVDGGDTWSELVNTPDFPSPQAWYDCFVGVDPTDENIVYGGGVFPSYSVAGIIKSGDGGQSWTDITFGIDGSQVHPDQHAIAFGPDGRLWIGNDGGVWRSDDAGMTWINRNSDLTVTQNYTVAVHRTDRDLIMAGTQDNGTIWRTRGSPGWPQVVGGDGGFLAFDFNSSARRYTTYVYLAVFRFSSQFGGFSDITGPWDSDPVNFIAPLVMDPGDAQTLLGGTNRIWQTTNADGNADWSAISTSAVSGGGTINAIGVGPGDTLGSPSDYIYSGSSTGAVWYTDDGGMTWNDRSAGLPGNGVSDLWVNPSDAMEAYVSHFRSSGGRIYRTLDSGATWDNATGTLPGGVTPNALAIDWELDPPAMYVGSGAGIWWSMNDGATWTKDGQDLPNVNIGDLYIDRINREIVAGTYGRGAWRSALAESCAGPIISQQPQPQSVCVGTFATFSVTATSETALSYQWRVDGADVPGATGPSYTVDATVSSGAVIDVVVENACRQEFSTSATLEIIDSPQFLEQPTDVSVCSGDLVFFFATVTDDPGYQWFHDGAAVAGATQFFLAVKQGYPCLSGVWTLHAENACGAAVSNAVTVLVEGCGAGDADGDTDVDMRDVGIFQRCFTGSSANANGACDIFDYDQDGDVDLLDWCSQVEIFSGQIIP